MLFVIIIKSTANKGKPFAKLYIVWGQHMTFLRLSQLGAAKAQTNLCISTLYTRSSDFKKVSLSDRN